MADPDEPENLFTDEMIDQLGTRADLSFKHGHPTGLVVAADGKRATELRRYVFKCPLCPKAINPEWLPEIERWQFECTNEKCRYTKRLGSAGFRRLLDQVTDANGVPIPQKSVTLPV